MPAIRTDGLTKRFGAGVVAVEDLDLVVEEGEVFGYLGPNGAGKSTTINVLLDYLRPTEGTATVLGYDAQDETQEIHERIGILPEGFDLYDRLTGRKHVEFAVDSKGSDDDPDEILDRVGLGPEAAGRKAGGYSTGMGQRLALGMALVGDPDLLILDEPSSGLDPNGARQMRELVREEASRGTTVFFSSHILGQVEAVCDRVGIMNGGRLVAEDTIEGLRESVGTSSTLELTVDRVPDDLSLDDIDAVTDLTADGNVLRIAVNDSGVKSEVINRVEAQGATVTDISTEQASLEDLFAAYTTEEVTA
ncbi:ABC transporter ATP-binding protein [Halorussus sp. MSC15.2]|uniref:ABC transporter ATP-binding protein n=1 Tax=Halorussus sp. MSC15.2 TaxID=2283638 RepID=UPI0013CF4503|nr:ABC transporter ATP-binding protein [Halorussus sp. MSC15.2]NEU57732.1 ABC transporter ATP-binding protein [Halorussus sp. MSC15.2]